MAASAGSAPRPAPPTSEVARSLSDHTSIFSAASARIFQVGPSNSLLAVSIDSSPFTDRRHEATESKYGSRVILTFVLRIPKVKLGAGGQASERASERASGWRRARRIHILIRRRRRRARPRLRLPPPPPAPLALGTRKPTRARRPGAAGMVTYLLREDSDAANTFAPSKQ